MDNNFNNQIDKWLTQVSEGCHSLAKLDERYPDFYVFQSKIHYKPELLIIGANPAGDTNYLDLLKRRGVNYRTKDDLANASNQYLDNPNWNVSRPLLQMFSDIRLRSILEKSVIMNAVYFNTSKVSDLRKFEHGAEMITFCTTKSLELIYNILSPKNILFNGKDASKWLGITFNDETDTVLHDGKKSWLIQKKVVNNINHYRILHTSRNYSFNTGLNLKMKKEYFEKNLK